MSDDLQLPQPTPNADARQWAMFCHFAAFAGLIIPFGNIVGPLLLWQLKKDLDPFVDAQGKEALNFQITVALAVLVSFCLMVVLIGFPLLMLISLTAFVLTVIAGVKANEGKEYRYPFTLRLVK
ncbi:DUF4870 domain-containing protein [Pseudomonas sp. TTU2014-080ASC]|jgi:uncharacterized Tic20 family protein|uniref:DUF4870 domain-containing protein n=1 Tax=Pseudomonas sp. TTU2014-080ASC TaxID=1729724 RepID=UPI0007186A45|nr:DUF4870 domain-containing protein [Pseudomonas sp. TTU2014-080ASC]KRW61264.1 orotate phosphoribosyltransferase [Pseudomonas sp. TTU2014-080ASC]